MWQVMEAGFLWLALLQEHAVVGFKKPGTGGEDDDEHEVHGYR